MSTVTEAKVTWDRYRRQPGRVLAFVQATGQPVAIVLRHGVDGEFPENDEEDIVVAYLVPAELYEAPQGPNP